MNAIFKSKVAAFALGIVAVTMMSVASASAVSTTRDHRTKPEVRDHRTNKPEVRDHRKDPQPDPKPSRGGVSVTDTE